MAQILTESMMNELLSLLRCHVGSHCLRFIQKSRIAVGDVSFHDRFLFEISISLKLPPTAKFMIK